MKSDQIRCRFSKDRWDIPEIKAAVLNVGVNEGRINSVIAGRIQDGINIEVRVFLGATPQMLEDLVSIRI